MCLLGGRHLLQDAPGGSGRRRPEDRAWLRGKRLLDIGCGNGRETAELWLLFGGDIHITAIDPVPGMIEHAEHNFEKHVDTISPDHPPITPQNRPDFKLASATQLPFEDNSFDATFWLHVLHWTSDPGRAISEAAACVHPGGLSPGQRNAFKPEANPYFNLVIRAIATPLNSSGATTTAAGSSDQGVETDLVTPAGFMCARNCKESLAGPGIRESTTMRNRTIPSEPNPLPRRPNVSDGPA